MRTAGHMERLYFERKLHVQPLSLDYVWLRDGCFYHTVIWVYRHCEAPCFYRAVDVNAYRECKRSRQVLCQLFMLRGFGER